MMAAIGNLTNSGEILLRLLRLLGELCRIDLLKRLAVSILASLLLLRSVAGDELTYFEAKELSGF